MISIVIPVLNEESFIRECLESLKNQDSAGKYEVIIVDNGSRDNTVRIARQIGVKVVFCSRQGVTHARQAGAEAAKGEIVVQADADTVYPHNWLACLKKQFILHPGAIAVSGTFIYKNPPWWAGYEYFLRKSINVLAVMIVKRPIIVSGANFAFYKSAWVEIGGYEPDKYSSDQFNISSRLSKVGKIAYNRKSYCITSERSVVRPMREIIIAFLHHIYDFTAYNIKTHKIPSDKRKRKWRHSQAEPDLR